MLTSSIGLSGLMVSAEPDGVSSPPTLSGGCLPFDVLLLPPLPFDLVPLPPSAAAQPASAPVVVSPNTSDAHTTRRAMRCCVPCLAIDVVAIGEK
jgi:hypothetical protein